MSSRGSRARGSRAGKRGAGRGAGRGGPGGVVATTVLTAALVLLAVLATGTPAASAQTAEGRDHVLVDLEPGASYVTAVQWLHGAGHINGVAPGRYGPHGTMTRADVFTLLWRVAARPAAPPSNLLDVARSAPYAAAVDWAVATNLTSVHRTHRHFNPNERADRADLVLLLWRLDGSPSAPGSWYPDVPRNTDYTRAVDWAVSTGLPHVVGATRMFEPNSPLTRVDAAAFVWGDAGRPAPAAPRLPAYRSGSDTISARSVAHTWRPGCPVGPEDLRALVVRYIGFDGRPHDGQLIVHRDAVGVIDLVFAHMYEHRFPIERVAPADEVGGSDDAAMAANLTSAFNCRRVTGGTGWSEHSYGRAIDINPLQNPYISRSGQVLPPGGAAHVDRARFGVGRISAGSAPVNGFEFRGWEWGGRWTSPRDYQHFSANGR